MKFTRDGAIWLVLLVAGLATFLAGHFDLLTKAFPALGATWQARIELIAAIAGFVGGYLRMSPAPLSTDHELATRAASRTLTMTGKVPIVLLACLLGLPAPARAQDVDKARALMQQAMPLVQQAMAALDAPPPKVVLSTPADFDAARAAAAPGAVLTLSPTLVYPTLLTITKPVTLVTDGLPLSVAAVRMDATTPLAFFQDGIKIVGDNVTVVGLEVRKKNPLVDIVTFTGASVTLDRMRVLGDPVKGAKRCIAANGNGNAVVIRNYADDCFQSYPGNDSQALIAWDMAPGLLVEDNFLRGGSETILLGGADPSTPERTPRNVVIRHNTITKRPEWQALAIGVKNTLEIKNAINVLVVDNDISYCWGGKGQDGYLLALTVRNQDGRAPWSTILDVTVTGNRFAHAAAAMNILGIDNIKETKANMPTPIGTQRPSARMSRVTIQGNAFTDIDPVTYTGSNRLNLIGAGPDHLTIDQNTFDGVKLGSQVYLYGAPLLDAFVLTNNAWPKSTYGIRGDSASGAAVWPKYVASGTLSGNVER